MKKIPSFTVNHLTLRRGVYVSRKDVTPSGDILTTFDIRMTEPNRMPALDGKAIHAMEHLAATYMRNNPEWADKVIYWGPMGCLTGNYLILSGDYTPADIIPLLKDTFSFISAFEGDVPGASPRDCGNYTFMDLPAAKREAARFLHEVLDGIGPEAMEYPD